MRAHLRQRLRSCLLLGEYHDTLDCAPALCRYVGACSRAVASPSKWVNQRGSLLSIQTLDASTGNFAGTYVNNATEVSCQGQPYLVAGVVTANRIAFYVNWTAPAAPNCATITIWNGRVADKNIPTAGTLFYVGSD
ncbi:MULTISPECIES: avidin/streptavidin family protein [Bradyrhizobium]|uniref:avidin/streptavidin family protein n=1 Tax=Bradyrhizobium TaxID=374 RepID=UPI00155F0871|nr:hypothetical protein [Bradyrhizobium sp. WBAH30]MDD1546326.1 hypothetical protein [Bradyrhizobium sp. WBAH41]MDD1560490.1 hypothetical protein [Bradyrhizobium sp. WBAH23]MDD1567332.1 hypothetical protein [Bradyrhizobium sp. WBAH33]MDD1594143.1 hypothetical protein [Bradyrhizobium sp. WBAH42]NRB90817.1 hypothetical protein [Bradyrhizobium sp. WBAH10]QCJ93507.1 hypothetical protein DAA57_37495 [Bradyrhizobium yuanmingense]